jgi:hypothetical protein
VTWDRIKPLITSVSGELLGPRGYKLVKSRDAFEKMSKSERRGVYLGLVASNVGNYWMQPCCGMQNNMIQECFHRTSGIDKGSRHYYTTINLRAGDDWLLNSEHEIEIALAGLRRFLVETALPFLEREYSYQDYCDLLNRDPEGNCPHQMIAQHRCHYGLIAARLAGDPRYDELKQIYATRLQRDNSGFYYPPFEKLVADLESRSREELGGDE